MLSLIEFRYATVEELFEYKNSGFTLPDCPGYTTDQWGIKAHNRPWIATNGLFAEGQKIIEVGGGYSSLPSYLAEKYQVEAWIGDDYGSSSGESDLWTRWGDPSILKQKYPSVKYVHEAFGSFSKNYPDSYFDRVFSVSTLEHIPSNQILKVMKDMHRVLAPAGMELHSIDVTPTWYGRMILNTIKQRLSLRLKIDLCSHVQESSWNWLQTIKDSGVNTDRVTPDTFPYDTKLLNKGTLFESYDVTYRFYPPNETPKQRIILRPHYL